jgi:hypothetical protein
LKKACARINGGAASAGAAKRPVAASRHTTSVRLARLVVFNMLET